MCRKSYRLKEDSETHGSVPQGGTASSTASSEWLWINKYQNTGLSKCLGRRKHNFREGEITVKVGIWEFGLLQKKFACEKIWVVGCMHCPVGGAEGTRCDSAMGGEVWRSRIFQGLGPGGVCHLTLSKHTDQHNIVFFVCLFWWRWDFTSIHPSIFSYTVISRDSGLQEVLEPIPAVNGQRWSWVGNMSKQHQTAQKENYTAAIINVKSSLKLTEKINQRLNFLWQIRLYVFCFSFLFPPPWNICYSAVTCKDIFYWHNLLGRTVTPLFHLSSNRWLFKMTLPQWPLAGTLSSCDNDNTFKGCATSVAHMNIHPVVYFWIIGNRVIIHLFGDINLVPSKYLGLKCCYGGKGPHIVKC